ncbi:hypothetical protein, partial [Methylogaea oryzae]
GAHLDGPGTVTALLENERSAVLQELSPTAAPSPTGLSVHLPSVAEDADAMHQWAIGFYRLSLRVARPDAPAWTTNGVPIALAPLISVSPLNAAPGNLDLELTCTPRLRPEQEKRATLLFGSDEIAPTAVTNPADPQQPTTLSFSLPGVAAGEYLVRLRVEGIDSLPVTLTGSPAKFDFDPQQKVVVA